MPQRDTPGPPRNGLANQETHDRPHRVLVVDDERSVCELFRRTLLMGGFDVVVACGGAEGLERLGSDPGIGLVLLDLHMPRIDGIRFRAVQLADPRLAAVPTVLVTGYAVTDSDRAAIRANEYVSKPVSPARLIALAEKYCRVLGNAPLPQAPTTRWTRGATE